MNALKNRTVSSNILGWQRLLEGLTIPNIIQLTKAFL
jgi:hypothetical protein